MPRARHSLLPDVEMQEAADLPLSVRLFRAFLEGADQDHLLEPVERFLAGYMDRCRILGGNSQRRSSRHETLPSPPGLRGIRNEPRFIRFLFRGVLFAQTRGWAAPDPVVPVWKKLFLHRRKGGEGGRASLPGESVRAFRLEGTAEGVLAAQRVGDRRPERLQGRRRRPGLSVPGGGPPRGATDPAG